MAKVLVLDDVRDAAIMVQKILQRKGHEVHIFNDEDDALRHVDSQTIDLAIIDAKLKKMDGLDVLAEIKKKQPKTAVIILTGFPTMDAAQRAIKLGAAAYCAKPIDKDELENKVETALRLCDSQ